MSLFVDSHAAADIVISRSGASAGTTAQRVNHILIPFSCCEDHQAANALALVNNNAGVLVKDSEAKERLFTELDSLLSDGKRTVLTRNIEKLKIESLRSND